MVTGLSGVQFGLWSYQWLTSRSLIIMSMITDLYSTLIQKFVVLQRGYHYTRCLNKMKENLKYWRLKIFYKR